jgi:hypothetical protein
MELSLGASITVAPDVVFRELQGEAVLLNLESGTYFGLNEIGTRIWQLIGEHGTLQKVFDQMCHEYDVAPATLESDLHGLVGELSANGLVVVSPH